jgi:ATP-dependent DNA ligase
MEARSVEEIPQGPEWQYEPKWDGFRCILARDAGDIAMFSKSGQDLKRYFPEIVAAALDLNAKSFILDGEIIVPVEGQFSFDDLLQRIHPAASRVKRLAAETPALYLAFDLLKEGTKDVAAWPLERWLGSAGGGSDGIIAKRLDLPYQVGNREGMQKIKKFRSADCVIGGFRYAQKKQANRQLVGSILLGLYDAGGLLHHVGFSSGIKAKDKAVLTDKLEDVAQKQSFTGTAPGGPSRWSSRRSSEWTPVKPKYVVEVSYDHFTGGRFRHGTSILRWRPDKRPDQCTMDQVKQKSVRGLVSNILANALR